MPYDTLSELPDSVKSSLPEHGQEIYQSAYSDAWDESAFSPRATGPTCVRRP